jgi:hypothetical protein
VPKSSMVAGSGTGDTRTLSKAGPKESPNSVFAALAVVLVKTTEDKGAAAVN